jgi:magnesium-transporting ATPase (P-type)
MPNKEIVPLTFDQILLKGCQLRNTGHCYGIAVYTGHQSKIMMNSLKQRTKKSKMEIMTNYYILMIILIEFIVCSGSAAYSCIWFRVDGRNISYLGFEYSTS